jgi:hypothetical protein
MKQARAGDAETLVVVPPMVSIDARAVNVSSWGHAYLTESADIIADLGDVLAGKRPEERSRLERVGVAPRAYWRFPGYQAEPTNFGKQP